MEDPYVEEDGWEDEEAMLTGEDNDEGDNRAAEDSQNHLESDHGSDSDSDLLWAVTSPYSEAGGLRSSGSAMRRRRAELRFDSSDLAHGIA